MSFRNDKLSACHLAPMVDDTTCSHCGGQSNLTVEEIDYYMLSESLELNLRRWADGDLKWSQAANAIKGEVIEHMEKTLNDLRLQMANKTIPHFVYSPDRERWVATAEGVSE